MKAPTTDRDLLFSIPLDADKQRSSLDTQKCRNGRCDVIRGDWLCSKHLSSERLVKDGNGRVTLFGSAIPCIFPEKFPTDSQVYANLKEMCHQKVEIAPEMGLTGDFVCDNIKNSNSITTTGAVNKFNCLPEFEISKELHNLKCTNARQRENRVPTNNTFEKAFAIDFPNISKDITESSKKMTALRTHSPFAVFFVILLIDTNNHLFFKTRHKS